MKRALDGALDLCFLICPVHKQGPLEPHNKMPEFWTLAPFPGMHVGPRYGAWTGLLRKRFASRTQIISSRTSGVTVTPTPLTAVLTAGLPRTGSDAVSPAQRPVMASPPVPGPRERRRPSAGPRKGRRGSLRRCPQVPPAGSSPGWWWRVGGRPGAGEVQSPPTNVPREPGGGANLDSLAAGSGLLPSTRCPAHWAPGTPTRTSISAGAQLGIPW